MKITPPELQAILERPQFAHTRPRDRDHPFVTVSVDLIKDKDVSVHARLLMVHLLALPPLWKGWRIPVIAKELLGVSLRSAEKYVAELVDAGYLHKVTIKAPKGDGFIYRYKLTEVKMPTNEPRKHTLLRDYHRQPDHTDNQPEGFTKPRRGVIKGAPRPPRPALRHPEPATMKPGEEPTKEELRQSARDRVRSSFFVPERIGKNFRANKGRKKKILSSKESKPLTPFAKGDSSSVDCRVVAEAPQGSTPTPETAGAKEAAAPPAPRKPSASARRAAFDAAKHTAPWADSDKLEPLVPESRTVDRDLISTWGVHVEGGSLDDDIEEFLRHPVTGMLQLILGYSSWTYAEARRWRRKAGRGVPASEILALYRAYSTEFYIGPIGTEYGHIPGNVRDLLRHGGNFRRAKCSPCALTRQHFPHDFIPYDQCLAKAEAILGDRPWNPADSLENDFN